MGEAKRREQLRSVVDDVTKRLTDEGKIIEAGWASLKLMAIPKDASETQLQEMRTAFFAGAHHLFGSMMSFLEEGEEETENDLKRMDLVAKELAGFMADFKMKHMSAEPGTAQAADEKLQQMGRLALRQEGNNWNAYYMMPNTPEGAVFLGSICMTAVDNNPARRDRFMQLMQDTVADIIEKATGTRPIWKEPQRAPEHEKAGNA
jgi:hypothetical protein